jgi:hypothetical protein
LHQRARVVACDQGEGVYVRKKQQEVSYEERF